MKKYLTLSLIAAVMLPVFRKFFTASLVACFFYSIVLTASAQPFNAPIITEAVGSSPMGIQVKFIDTNTNESGYYFYYSTHPDGPFQIEDFDFDSMLDSGQVLVYNTNSGYEGNTVLYIKIAAFAFNNSTGEYSSPGPFSELASATTEAGWPPSPTDFIAIAEPGHIRLTWTDNSEPGHPLDEAAWGIMRAVNSTNFSKGWTVPANTTEFVDNEVTPGVSYTYRLESINHFGMSFDVYYASAIAIIDSTTVQLIGLTTEGGAYGGGTMFIAGTDGSGPTTLYNFQSSTGSYPIGTLIQGQDGLLYGVSQSGGASGLGTIFRIEADGDNHTVLYNFTGDNGFPVGSLLQMPDGVLFGVTASFAAQFGTSYSINPDGSSYKELYRFSAPGSGQSGFLMRASNGVIYGAEYSGGAYGYGQVFRMKPDGSEPFVLQHFSWEDVESPYGGLIQANDGALYGVSQQGGNNAAGTIYRVLPDASVVNIVHLFEFNEGGCYPRGSVVQAPDGALYGMTNSCGANGFGTLYKVNPDGSDFTVLQNFDEYNGKYPVGNLVYYSNKLFGYATTGGLYGFGALFSYDLSTNTYTKLADLDGALGIYPKYGGLLLLYTQSAEAPTTASSGIGFTNVKSHSMTISFNPGNGMDHLVVMKTGSAPTFQPENDKLYFGDVGDGTTVVYNGNKTSIDLTGIAPGSTHFFTVFEYNTNYAGNIRYMTGGSPVASQTTLPYSESLTKMVGVTRFEGRSDAGTMYSMNPDGTDFTVLFNFNTTASHQIGTLFTAKDGYLYGVSKSGGAHAYGSLYKIKSDGTGYSVIYNFSREDGFPAGSPLQTENGTLFGVSTHDDSGYGMVYKMNADGSGHEELYRFTMGQGYRQPGYVMQASNGFLFVTTYAGGANGLGLILRMNPDGSNPMVVHDFAGESDGYFAYSKLTETTDAQLYGVAHLGGDEGAGVLYRIEADGGGFAVIHSFNDYEGGLPCGAVTQTPDGTLYGLTIVGGRDGLGTFYKINPDGTGFEVIQNYNRENGDAPLGDLTLFDNKLYGYTAAGGTFAQPGFGGGTLFSYDLGTASSNQLANLNQVTGTEPAFGTLLVVPPTELISGVQNFSLVDVRTGEELMDFDGSVSLDVGDPGFTHWTIRANTHPDQVGSVIFRIDNKKKNVTNKVPYLLQAPLNTLTLTMHTIKAEAFSERNGRGTPLQSKAAQITFINNTALTGFELLTMSGEKIQDLHDGDVLNTQDPSLRKFKIGALINRVAPNGSVQFILDGSPSATDNQPPYMISSGNWWNVPGLYSLTAKPFSGKNAKDLPGTPLTVTFFITNAALTGAPDSDSGQIHLNVYPIPATDELSILAENQIAGETAHVVIWSMSGNVYFDGVIVLTDEPFTMNLQQLELPKGINFIRIQTKGASEVFRLFKE